MMVHEKNSIAHLETLAKDAAPAATVILAAADGIEETPKEKAPIKAVVRRPEKKMQAVSSATSIAALEANVKEVAPSYLAGANEKEIVTVVGEREVTAVIRRPQKQTGGRTESVADSATASSGLQLPLQEMQAPPSTWQAQLQRSMLAHALACV